MKIEAAFEKVSKYDEVKLPNRKTTASAGYDFYAAEDTIIPSYASFYDEFKNATMSYDNSPLSLDEVSAITKKYKFKPTLVPTGVKCKLPQDYYLQLSVRSSLPLKDWLILGNSVGIIDADYYNNIDNEGHIYFQLINLSPCPILIKKGECFGQGIILPYNTCANENEVTATRIGGFGSTSK